jgi:uncharacterized membrane protein YqaE (UPF0057 family)
MKRIYLLTLVAIALIYSSCTVEKRHYMSGYHVEWNHKAPKIGGEGNATAENQVATPTTNSVEENNVVLVPTQSIAAEEVSVNTSATPIVNEMPSSVKTNSNKTSFHKENTKDKVLSENSSYTVAPNKTQTVNESPSVAQKSENYHDELLLIILAIFIPPLAVYLKDGSWNARCWIDLLLCFLFFLPGIIYALLIVLDEI